MDVQQANNGTKDVFFATLKVCFDKQKDYQQQGCVSVCHPLPNNNPSKNNNLSRAKIISTVWLFNLAILITF